MEGMKTAELTGKQLDFWVAQAIIETPKGLRSDEVAATRLFKSLGPEADTPFEPSFNWAQGGPIIENKKIMVAWNIDHWIAGSHEASEHPGGHIWTGRTPLIAAMRVCVASVFGDEVPAPLEGQ
jgi:hypothetical protein